jgi:phage terminase large subunit-like protein
VVSADVPNKHGISASCVIFDELLAQKTPDFYRVMTTGTGDARRNPLVFVISTAGTDKRSICYEIYAKAKTVLSGERVDYSLYTVIYEADKNDDPSSPDTWHKANPSLGITITEDKMRQAWESARGNPVEEKLFKQLRLNIWCDDVAKWLPIERWNDCYEAYGEDELRGRPCYGGLDLFTKTDLTAFMSTKTDLTAFMLVFPPQTDGEPFKVLLRDSLSVPVIHRDFFYDKFLVTPYPHNSKIHLQTDKTYSELKRITANAARKKRTV